MKEELISFTTAKLAKEKGYKDKSRQWEFKTKDGVYVTNVEGGIGGKEDTVKRPTQALLQKWLREVHFIETGVAPVRYAGDEKTSYYQPTLQMSTIRYRDKFKTWEEALEVALQEALKLINT